METPEYYKNIRKPLAPPSKPMRSKKDYDRKRDKKVPIIPQKVDE